MFDQDDKGISSMALMRHVLTNRGGKLADSTDVKDALDKIPNLKESQSLRKLKMSTSRLCLARQNQL